MNCRCKLIYVTIITAGDIEHVRSYQAVAVPRVGDRYRHGIDAALVKEVTWWVDEDGHQGATVTIAP